MYSTATTIINDHLNNYSVRAIPEDVKMFFNA